MRSCKSIITNEQPRIFLNPCLTESVKLPEMTAVGGRQTKTPEVTGYLVQGLGLGSAESRFEKTKKQKQLQMFRCFLFLCHHVIDVTEF